MILNYAKQQAARDGMVTYQSIGTSTEGREIGLVTISSGGGRSKPAIFIGMFMLLNNFIKLQPWKRNKIFYDVGK